MKNIKQSSFLASFVESISRADLWGYVSVESPANQGPADCIQKDLFSDVMMK